MAATAGLLFLSAGAFAQGVVPSNEIPLVSPNQNTNPPGPNDAIPPANGTAQPTGAAPTGQPTDTSANQTQIDDPNIPPAQRVGNCCIPSDAYHADRQDIECDWGVGNESQDPAVKIQDCKNLGGIHLEQSDWNLCNVQCGQEMGVSYCQGDAQGNYACSTTYNPNGLNTKVFLDSPSCQAACKPPVDLQTTVVCSCAPDQGNVCTVTVRENRGPNQSAIAHQATVSQIALRLSGTTDALTIVGNPSILDANGAPAQGLESMHPDNNLSNINFVPANSTIVIPAGGSVSATVSVPASADPSTVSTLRATVTSAGDPVATNNSDVAQLSNINSCSLFSLSHMCEIDSAGGHLSYTYSYLVPNDGTARQLAFTLPSACLDADHISPLPSNCSLQQLPANQALRTIDCTTSGTAAPNGQQPSPFETVTFTVPVLPDTQCAIGTAIPVTATLTVTGNATAQPVTASLIRNKDACGACDVCRNIDNQADCIAGVNVQNSPYCVWGFDPQTQQPDSCFPNYDGNDACNIWYGYCAVGSIDPPQMSYMFTSRINGQFTPDQASFTAAQTFFTDQQNSGQDNGAERWFDPPPIARSDAAPGERSIEQLRDECEANPSSNPVGQVTSRPGGQTQQANTPDYYCPAAYREEDVVTGGIAQVLTNLDSLPFDNYTNQDITKGTVFFSSVYRARHDVDHPTPLSAVEAAKIDGRLICYNSIKNFGTCATQNGCQQNITQQACAEHMFYPIGPNSLVNCQACMTTDAAGNTVLQPWCSGPPATFEPELL